MAPFLLIGFNCLKAVEPLEEDSVLLTAGFSGTHMIDPKRTKGRIEL